MLSPLRTPQRLLDRAMDTPTSKKKEGSVKVLHESSCQGYVGAEIGLVGWFQEVHNGRFVELQDVALIIA